MPHCWPQKQQWVFTRRSAGLRDSSCQPPGGIYAGCGPNCSVSTFSETGALATGFLFQAELRERQRLALARWAQFLPRGICSLQPVVETNLWKHFFQIVDVHPGGEPLAAPLAGSTF